MLMWQFVTCCYVVIRSRIANKDLEYPLDVILTDTNWNQSDDKQDSEKASDEIFKEPSDIAKEPSDSAENIVEDSSDEVNLSDGSNKDNIIKSDSDILSDHSGDDSSESVECVVKDTAEIETVLTFDNNIGNTRGSSQTQRLRKSGSRLYI